MVRLGLVQAPAGSNALENFDVIRQFAEEGKAVGCSALCFPEAFLTGYFPNCAGELALEKGHSLLSQIGDLARSLQLDLLVGFMEKEEKRIFLTHGIWHCDGTRDFYRKTHLGKKEALYFT